MYNDFKKNIRLTKPSEGVERRKNYEHIIFDKRPDFPLTVELKDIDADKVKKLLGTRNYTQMLYAMRSLCSTSSPFDAIKEWLDKEHLSYKESTVKKNDD